LNVLSFSTYNFHLLPSWMQLDQFFIFSLTYSYYYSKTNKMHLLSQIIYSCVTLYMFRTVFPSIIRSSRLYIQQQAYVKLKLQGWVKLLMNMYIGYSKM
jgi:hypothetical protein